MRQRGLTGISSPVYADDGDVLQQDQIRRDLLDRPRCEAYDHHSGFPFDAFQAGYDQALRIPRNKKSAPVLDVSPLNEAVRCMRRTYDGIVNHINPLPPSDLQDLLLPILCRIIDRMVRSTSFDTDLSFRFFRCRGDDLAAESYGGSLGWVCVKCVGDERQDGKKL